MWITEMIISLLLLQGDTEFETLRTRDASLDWPLLQQLSCRDPELFWTALLRDELRLPFFQAPTRSGKRDCGCLMRSSYFPWDYAGSLTGPTEIQTTACGCQGQGSISPTAR
jgi:hypothetical protein